MKRINQLDLSAIARSMVVLGACLAVLLLGGLPTTLRSGDSTAVVTYSTDTPEERQPGIAYRWSGADDEPMSITIPKIGVQGYIQKVGVDQNRQIAVPNNIHIAGWFVDSQKPGEKGLSILDGHVDGRSTSGIFKELDKLAVGDRFVITRGDLSEITYEVIATHTVDTAQAAEILFSQQPSVDSQLNLITCGGSYDRAAGQYLKRVIVHAKAL